MPDSIIYNILIYVSIIVWIFPAIKQYKTKYFFFFFIMAITDVFALGVRLFLSFNTINVYLFFQSILFVSFFNSTNFKKTIVWICLFSLIFLLNSFFLYIDNISFFILLMIITGIFYFIVVEFLHCLIIFYKFSIPLMLLVLYQVINITKTTTWMFQFSDFAFYYYSASTFQIIIGLFFSFISINDNRLNINLPVKKK